MTITQSQKTVSTASAAVAALSAKRTQLILENGTDVTVYVSLSSSSTALTATAGNRTVTLAAGEKYKFDGVSARAQFAALASGSVGSGKLQVTEVKQD